MRVWDKYGRLKTVSNPPTVNVTVVRNEVSAYKQYVLNTSDGLYYEILCSTDMGVVTFYPSDNGVAIPIQIPPLYVRNLTDNLYYEVKCSTQMGVVTIYPSDTGISIP